MNFAELACRKLLLLALTVASLIILANLPSNSLGCEFCGWGNCTLGNSSSQLQSRIDSYNRSLNPGGFAVGDRSFGSGGSTSFGGASPQVVYLNFDATPTGRYTTTMRTDVANGMANMYRGFDVTFTTSRPTTGPFTELIYDNAGLGGVADEIDFRNLNPNNTAFIGTNFTGSGFAGTVAQRTTYAINVGGHELGHTLGLRHYDSFGPIGSGVLNANTAANFLPDFTGPTSANEFFFNTMSTPAIGGNASFDNFINSNDVALGDRSLAKLSFVDQGPVFAETTSNNNSIATAQMLDLGVITSPQQRPLGTENGGMDLAFRAAVVEGAISFASDVDFFAFDAFAGDLVSIELISRVLDRIVDDIDGELRVFDENGNTLDYYGQSAFNDDEIESFDPWILDLLIPENGTYFVEVDNSTQFAPTDTGGYELYVYTYGAIPEPGAFSVLGLCGLLFFRRRRNLIRQSGFTS
jgi:hypothetical protein